MTSKLFEKINIGKTLLIFSILLVAIQGIWYSSSIKYSIPADEAYHYTFIKTYSQQPISLGPVIPDQPDSSYSLGDIERVSSFLYHYTLSFPQRIVNSLALSQETNILILRLFSVLFAALSVIVIYKTILLLSNKKSLAGLTAFLFSLIGMFLWVNSSVNYDSLAILTFYLFIYFSLKAIVLDINKFSSIVWAIFFGLFSMLIKATIYPTLILSAIITIYFLYKQRGELRLPPLAKRKIILPIILLILVTGIFSERIVVNALKYNSLNPACDRIHSVEKCLINPIFRRDYNTKQQIESSNKDKEISYKYFVRKWPKLMYDRLYFFFGHKSIAPNKSAFLSVILILSLIGTSLLIKRKKLADSPAEKLILIVTVFYFVQLFLFNLNSYIKWGAILGGYQGRYLLPVLPFFYYFIIKLLNITWQSYSNKLFKYAYFSVCVAIVGYFLYMHFPPKIFLEGTNANWYTDSTKEFNLNLKSRLERLTD